MKVTRMTVEGAKGWANIQPHEMVAYSGEGKMAIGIEGQGTAGLFAFDVGTRDKRGQELAAFRLHRELEGYVGTIGDVADYLRAVQAFAD